MALRIDGRTVGIQPRRQSDQKQAYLCVECAIAIAMGRIEPPRTQPLTMVAHSIICEMVANDPSIVVAAWKQLRKRLELPASVAFPEIEILPPGDRLRLAT
ncbi:MAG: hypothetical protein JO356_00990 [Acidobacteria bacterium]|nr:hypothetical protein [Acidobacteriota bacterium]